MKRILAVVFSFISMSGWAFCPEGGERHVNPDSTLGGYVGVNVEVIGPIYVAPDARVCGNVRIGPHVEVLDDSSILEEAWVRNHVTLYGQSSILGQARVEGDTAYMNVELSEQAQVYGSAKVFAKTRISGESQVFDNAQVRGFSLIAGKSKICFDSRIDSLNLQDDDTKCGGENKTPVGAVWSLDGVNRNEVSAIKDTLTLRLAEGQLDNGEPVIIKINSAQVALEDIIAVGKTYIKFNAKDYLIDGFNIIDVTATMLEGEVVENGLTAYFGNAHKGFYLDDLAQAKKIEVHYLEAGGRYAVPFKIAGNRILMNAVVQEGRHEILITHRDGFLLKYFTQGEEEPLALASYTQATPSLGVMDVPQWYEVPAGDADVDASLQIVADITPEHSMAVLLIQPSTGEYRRVDINPAYMDDDLGISWAINASLGMPVEVSPVVLALVENNEDLAIHKKIIAVNTKSANITSSDLGGDIHLKSYQALNRRQRSLPADQQGLLPVQPLSYPENNKEECKTSVDARKIRFEHEDIRFLSVGNVPARFHENISTLAMPVNEYINILYGELKLPHATVNKGIKELYLSIRENGVEVARGELSPCAKHFLKESQDASDKKFHYLPYKSMAGHLFYVTASELRKIIPNNVTLSFQLGVVFDNDEVKFKAFPSLASKLMAFEKGNDRVYGGVDRYDSRNETFQRVGGDKWMNPSMEDPLSMFLEDQRIRINDISKMNGGIFSEHHDHREGFDFDMHYRNCYTGACSKALSFDELLSLKAFVHKNGSDSLTSRIRLLVVQNESGGADYPARRVFDRACIGGRYSNMPYWPAGASSSESVSNSGRTTLVNANSAHNDHFHVGFYPRQETISSSMLPTEHKLQDMFFTLTKTGEGPGIKFVLGVNSRLNRDGIRTYWRLRNELELGPSTQVVFGSNELNLDTNELTFTNGIAHLEVTYMLPSQVAGAGIGACRSIEYKLDLNQIINAKNLIGEGPLNWRYHINEDGQLGAMVEVAPDGQNLGEINPSVHLDSKYVVYGETSITHPDAQFLGKGFIKDSYMVGRIFADNGLERRSRRKSVTKLNKVISGVEITDSTFEGTTYISGEMELFNMNVSGDDSFFDCGPVETDNGTVRCMFKNAQVVKTGFTYTMRVHEGNFTNSTIEAPADFFIAFGANTEFDPEYGPAVSNAHVGGYVWCDGVVSNGAILYGTGITATGYMTGIDQHGDIIGPNTEVNGISYIEEDVLQSNFYGVARTYSDGLPAMLLSRGYVRNGSYVNGVINIADSVVDDSTVINQARVLDGSELTNGTTIVGRPNNNVQDSYQDIIDSELSGVYVCNGDDINGVDQSGGSLNCSRKNYVELTVAELHAQKVRERYERIFRIYPQLRSGPRGSMNPMPEKFNPSTRKKDYPQK